jgi:ACR3 family arsenite efflux pump ArsB
MLKLLQQIQKRLIVAIPIIMIAGFGAGLVWDSAPLKQWIVPLTFLMVYPMMVNLQLKKVIEGGDGKVQLVTQLLNFTVIPLFAFLLGKLAFPDSRHDDLLDGNGEWKHGGGGKNDGLRTIDWLDPDTDLHQSPDGNNHRDSDGQDL